MKQPLRLAKPLIASALLLGFSTSSLPALAEGGFIPLKPLGGTYGQSSSTASSANSLSTWNPTTKTWQTTANPAPRKDLSASTTSNSSSLSTYSSTKTYSAGVSALGAGINFPGRLNEPISSQLARVGDPVTATLDSPISSNGSVVAPAGSMAIGTVTHVLPQRNMGRHGEVGVRFYTLEKPNGEKVAINGIIVTKSGAPYLKGDTYTMDIVKGAGVAVGGTALGAVTGVGVGGLLGVAGTGAAVGTAVGAAAGIGYALYRKGRAVEIPKGDFVRIKLLDPNDVNAAKPVY